MNATTSFFDRETASSQIANAASAASAAAFDEDAAAIEILTSDWYAATCASLGTADPVTAAEHPTITDSPTAIDPTETHAPTLP
ncbi:hypothetical protein F6X56_20520 [Rhodococcus erythropolis]|uniref:Uncharacterized protein n=2 Tax=Rhodococcus TaxID=1827 RepID=A0A1Q4K7R3_RHOER|nr:hypothetical protein AOT96_28400 [Rhodococcus sp. 008]EEN88584.1 hypothetical protein RHOER0001_4057 [Rhodococcus erythropolis SK121]KPH21517.1 hypothetical protein AN948_01265 [Rhodococcus sp. ADH]KZL31755.1 hypothetical protein A3852_19415 [Rhodococcus qingshengii]MBW0289600.1 hypothetical protein [Rhodococcus sp. MH15]MCE4165688.1 hypothetical protein [Rhodococcus sp. Ni2]OKA16001.1 hypothetical protein BS618_05400 [Rhodococcus erythropolis]